MRHSTPFADRRPAVMLCQVVRTVGQVPASGRLLAGEDSVGEHLMHLESQSAHVVTYRARESGQLHYRADATARRPEKINGLLQRQQSLAARGRRRMPLTDTQRDPPSKQAQLMRARDLPSRRAPIRLGGTVLAEQHAELTEGRAAAASVSWPAPLSPCRPRHRTPGRQPRRGWAQSEQRPVTLIRRYQPRSQRSWRPLPAPAHCWAHGRELAGQRG